MRPFDFTAGVGPYSEQLSATGRVSGHAAVLIPQFAIITPFEQFESWAKEPPAFVIAGFITTAPSSIFRGKAATNNHMRFAL